MASLIQKKLGGYSAYYFEDPALIEGRQQPHSKQRHRPTSSDKHVKHSSSSSSSNNRKQGKSTDNNNIVTITDALTRKLAALEPQTIATATHSSSNTNYNNDDLLDPAHLFSGTRLANKYRKLSQSSCAYDYRALLDTTVLPDAVTLHRLGFKELQPQHLKIAKAKKNKCGSQSEAKAKWVSSKENQLQLQLNPAVLERYEPRLDNTPFLPTHSVFGSGVMREQAAAAARLRHSDQRARAVQKKRPPLWALRCVAAS